MLHGQRVVVVMPAYRAEKTLAACYRAIPHDVVDEVLLVDDASDDETLAVARGLGLTPIRHAINEGYGANQKTCYCEALRAGADIVVMVHPDYQYEPRLITALASLVASGVYDVAIGSRMLGRTALAGGMPRYKYHANRLLTACQNLMTGARLSEYHTGFRAFSRRVLETLPLGRQFVGFRVRQPDAGSGARIRHAHRRSFVPHPLFRTREPDQLPPLGRLRAGCAAHQRCVPIVALAPRLAKDFFRTPRVQAVASRDRHAASRTTFVNVGAAKPVAVPRPGRPDSRCR